MSHRPCYTYSMKIETATVTVVMAVEGSLVRLG